ncbi:hypothetical protein F7Q99_28420 [Streptomyces kaniharaensis]|uniref:Uncharacterized protein n=1 Tax=Streptomyces kaniharaensis TaxID=212423 RepID=A0A6N7KX54_9ACTN|nr:hypothetical protein [Streptomyces kaniharaensis]MQS16061.1 hypothetical protein [Streptomyces kaniharaensis]
MPTSAGTHAPDHPATCLDAARLWRTWSPWSPQIIVVEIPDPLLTSERLSGPDRLEEEVRGLRLGATQAIARSHPDPYLRHRVEHQVHG